MGQDERSAENREVMAATTRAKGPGQEDGCVGEISKERKDIIGPEKTGLGDNSRTSGRKRVTRRRYAWESRRG